MKIPVKVKIDGVKKLDKYEYNLKLEEIDKLVDQGDYEEAANLADTIEWKRVRNVRTLCLISEIYEVQDGCRTVSAFWREPTEKHRWEEMYCTGWSR